MDIARGRNGKHFYIFPKDYDLDKALGIVAEITHKSVEDLVVKSAKDAGEEFLIYESKKVGEFWAICRKEGK